MIGIVFCVNCGFGLQNCTSMWTKRNIGRSRSGLVRNVRQGHFSVLFGNLPEGVIIVDDTHGYG